MCRNIAAELCDSNAQKIRKGFADTSKIRMRASGLASGANDPFAEATHAVLDRDIDNGEFDDFDGDEEFEPVVKKSHRRSTGRDCAPGKVCTMGGRIV